MSIPEDLTDCPYYLITRASLVVTGYLRRMLAEAGAGQVRPAYLGVLMSLWREDGLKVVELGRRAGLEPSTMTGLVDRMERDGLLARRPDPDDRRAQRIHLTDEGRRVEGAVSQIVDRTLGSVLEGVDEDDMDRLKTALRRVLSNTHRLSGS
jgi:DNA-binding MarR family transcriptional regulator